MDIWESLKSRQSAVEDRPLLVLFEQSDRAEEFSASTKTAT